LALNRERAKRRKTRLAALAEERVRMVAALMVLFGFAIAALYLAQAMPPRIVAQARPIATVSAETFSVKPVDVNRALARSFAVQLPRKATDRSGGVPYLEGLRNAGLLHGYSLPPDKLIFVPGGGVQYWPVSQFPTGPRPPVAVTHGDRSRQRVALTFDDCYYGLGKLLDTLTQLRVPATIFPTGGAANGHKDLIREARDRGFEIANHTCTHVDVRRLPTPIATREIADCNSIVRSISGTGTAAFFRPPGGAFDARILQIASSLGYVVVNWTRDTEDWKPTTTADQIFARATQGVQGGDIILMHSQGPHTLEALPGIVKYLRGKGFELTTVSGVLE